MFMIDTSTAFGARMRDRLDNEKVVWLTTVGRSGTPQPNPVWFLFTGDQIIMFSEPGKAKLHNLQARPAVALNFNATPTGSDIGVITGAAVIDENGPSADELAAYDAKYADDIAGLNLTPEQFHQAYSVLVRIAPAKLRGF
jgi:PPOX class probable F420-dependent enzyme